MRTLPFLLALGATAGLQMGANFSCSPARSIEIISPPAGVVGTCDLEVSFALVGSFDLSTLQAKLNGKPLIVNGDGPAYTVHVDPGAPLVIDGTNQIMVQANRISDGVPVSAMRSFDYVPPPASAREITSTAELIEGPLAHGELGDYLLENGCARFIVQKPGLRDFNQIGAFGGNLIDAEIVENGVRKGNDNFWEVQPAVNIESVVNAQSVQIVNDGVDGNPAVVDTCGPDDLLDGINPSTAAVDAGGSPLAPSIDDKDYNVTGCTAYSLARGKRYLSLTTTIENNETTALPLFVGDYVSGAGELEQWTPLSVGGFFAQAGVGEMLVNLATDALTFFGFDAAQGVDYALVPSKPPPTFARSSSFSVTGVSYVLNHYSIPLALFGFAPNFVVPAQVGGVPGTRSFTRYFAVGNGSASNAIAVQLEKEGIAAGSLQVCVADASQTPIPGARVVVAQSSSGGTGSADVLRGHWVADEDGCVDGRLPAGNYLLAAAKEGYPYEGGGSVPATTLVTVPSGGAVRHDITLPETGHLRVNVVDESGAAMPGRVAVVGFDPSPERLLSATVAVVGTINTALIYDQADAIPRGLSRTEYANGSGVLQMDLEPGDYQIAVSRGNEYSLYKEHVTVGAGGLTTVNAKLVRVLDTPGFISSDYHVHMIDSPDSRISKGNRVLSMAGEGVENIIATDHSVITNLASTIADLGVGPFVHSTPGEEITSFDTGHYNAYPQGLDPTRVQTHGSTDWAGAAPPGQDFPSFGNYILSPAEIENLALTDPDNAGLDTVVQINHIGSQFSPLKINTALVPPASVLAPGDAAKYRLDPGVANFFHHFPALELWNGMNVAHQNEFLLERIGVWMNLLNQGFVSTAISDTDTHDFHNLRSGGARTWTPSSTDAPAAINDNEIGLAVKAGKAVGGQGIFVLTRLVADSTGETTGFELGDQTIDVTVPVVPPKVVQRPGVRTTDGAVHLDIDIQAPAWAPYDRIEIYTNSATTVKATNGGVPVLFGAVPDITLNLGAGDFTRTVVDKSPPGPPIPGASRFETQKRVTFSGATALAEDTWIVVVVKGTSGNSPPMFPVHPSDLSAAQNPTLADLETVTAGENGVRSLGVANALFVDMDGNPGFDPPITP
jgi:Ni,Fe-hydrogenase III small subunit